MENNLAYKLKEGKLACKIQEETGCSWVEAFTRAGIELFGGEE